MTENKELLFQYEFIRREGRYNMLDIFSVASRAFNLSFTELALFMQDRKAYARFIFSYEQPAEDDFQAWLAEMELDGAL